jgi:hypothetical protein
MICSNAAWIDRPVDTQGCALCFHVIPSAAWKRTMPKPKNNIPVGFSRESPLVGIASAA